MSPAQVAVSMTKRPEAWPGLVPARPVGRLGNVDVNLSDRPPATTLRGL